MRDDNQQKNLLRNLARIDSEAAKKALEEQASKIAAALEASSSYEELDGQLELLDLFIFRVPDRGLKMIEALLERLPEIKLIFENEEYIPIADNLTKKAISVVSNLRFLETEGVLKLLVNHLDSEDKEVAEFCAEELKKLANFNITVLKHIGLEPQRALLSKIESLPDQYKKAHLSELIDALSELLEPTAHDTSSDYRSMTWHTGSMHPTKELASLRDQTIRQLISIYGTLEDVASKKVVLAGLKKAMDLPTMSDYGPEIEKMVQSDFQGVIAFYNEIAAQADVVELEEIESQTLFFQFRGLEHGTESQAVQELRKKLAADPEYAIYKVLAADHDAFEDYWSNRTTWSFEAHEKFRTEKIDELVAGIDSGNLDDWIDRILAIKERASPYGYRQYFFTFLERFGREKPELALVLLRGKHEELGWFVAPLLDGLWDSKLHDEASDLIGKWVESSQHLDVIVRVLAAKHIEDDDFVSELMSKAIEMDAQDVLCELTSIAVDRSPSNEPFYREIFLKSLSALRDDNTGWCSWARFQRKFPEFIAKLDEPSINLILSRLANYNDVSYEIEEILRPIASKYPEKVISFFAQRRTHESEVRKEELWSSRYDAIPFQLHGLQEELGKHPALVFAAIYEWFSKDTLWAWEAARLLAIIFPGFPPAFEKLLIDKIRHGTDEETLNVLSILKEYDGDTRIHDACKEAIKRFPESKDVRNAALIALDTTGVVSGEFGFRDAHVRKKEETASWLKDEDAGVRAFAEHYRQYLDSRIEQETADAERDIAIRKKVYGEGAKDL